MHINTMNNFIHSHSLARKDRKDISVQQTKFSRVSSSVKHTCIYAMTFHYKDPHFSPCIHYRTLPLTFSECLEIPFRDITSLPPNTWKQSRIYEEINDSFRNHLTPPYLIRLCCNLIESMRKDISRYWFQRGKNKNFRHNHILGLSLRRHWE